MLSVQNLTYSIHNVTLLDKISLNVKDGEFIGIIGPNGSGKSTLIKNICKHLTPKGGTITIDDINIHDMTNKKLSSMLSVVMQESETPFDFTVEEILQMATYHKKTLFESENNEDKKEILRALHAVNLDNFANRSFLSLSGGEKQRVIIARALVQNTDVLVLDEPTNHLDLGSQHKTLQMLKNSKKTIVAALHDLSIASKYCDRIYVLNHGNVIRHGIPIDVIDSSLIQELYDIHCEVFTHNGNLHINYQG